MIHTEFPQKYKDGCVHVTVEKFSTSAELLSVCSERTLVHRELEHVDYFEPYRHISSPDWTGVKDRETLMDMAKNGIPNTDTVRSAVRASMNVKTKKTEMLRSIRMDTAGGGVNVQRFLAGEPECMYSLRYKRVKSKIVKIAVCTKALCDITPEEILKAGTAVTRTISKLEQCGYRIRLDVVEQYEDSSHKATDVNGTKCDSTIVMFTLTVKGEGEMMNYSRIMFPITKMCFHRGIGFGWLSRCKQYPANIMMGGSLLNILSEEELDKLNKRAIGDDWIFVPTAKVARMYRNGASDEAVDSFLEKLFTE